MKYICYKRIKAGKHGTIFYLNNGAANEVMLAAEVVRLYKMGEQFENLTITYSRKVLAKGEIETINIPEKRMDKFKAQITELIKLNKSPFTSETGKNALKLKSHIELDLSDKDFNNYFEFCKQMLILSKQ